ncbi:MAG: hypothetical protein QG570_47 [Patescibacteria group bacterium]|nr:hypothetical protein [Patescibacteria group bacterium]
MAQEEMPTGVQNQLQVDPVRRRLEKQPETTPQRMEKYEEFRKAFKERTELRVENLKGKFSEQQQARLSLIKEHTAKSQARLLKATEKLTEIVDRVEKRIVDSGFENDEASAKLIAIQTEIDKLEVEITGLTVKYENIEELEVEEIKAMLKELKDDTRSIISQLKTIKTDLKEVISSLE